ncbi:MAG: LytTR family DNA-binding domain-containing protein [Lachnospiraceae bacterium]|nr:LytTR family DNA-binding domain-containing protein [Lachnospiraceae bacterium]
MQIYVCDDEPQILKVISEKIRSYLPDDTVTGLSSGRELMERMAEVHCDILFLDIDMPDLTGMDIAQQLNAREQKLLLVFVTSHDELVYESLQYHPFGFIRKSCFEKEIRKILDDCQKEMSSRQKHFHFRMAGQDMILPLSDILYFEADGNYLKVFTWSGTERQSTVSGNAWEVISYPGGAGTEIRWGNVPGGGLAWNHIASGAQLRRLNPVCREMDLSASIKDFW